ncbi:hypothetical protein CMQ_5 [Grosmannia clavigera kw1407]|uniref:Uncharacterized protein n=1 Tax=Grosmannia clavigera (strain kw1407 / UAMH 11150) TaxID=655863 RepID=F0XRK1_GROCL|nr:uncharacterized protein CMQ_5 [Grosmannia clavigera kw1407]EFW99687.1 hypothetical protein CMQ_5 [Grosmannia clavigera kw1407]
MASRTPFDRSASLSLPRAESQDTPQRTLMHRSMRHSLPTQQLDEPGSIGTISTISPVMSPPSPGSSSRPGHDRALAFHTPSYRHRIRNRMADVTGNNSGSGSGSGSSSRPVSPLSDPLAVPMALPPLSQSSSSSGSMGSRDGVLPTDQSSTPLPSPSPPPPPSHSSHHRVRKILRLTGIGSSSRSSGHHSHKASAAAVLRSTQTTPDLLSPLASPAPSRQRSFNKVRQLTGMDLDDGDISAKLASSSMPTLAGSSRAMPTSLPSRSANDLWDTSIFDSDDDDDEEVEDELEVDDDTATDRRFDKGKNACHESDPDDGILPSSAAAYISAMAAAAEEEALAAADELTRWPTLPAQRPTTAAQASKEKSVVKSHGRSHAYSLSGSSGPKFVLFPPSQEAAAKMSTKTAHRHMSIASLSGPPRALASMTQQQQMQQQQQLHYHHMRSKSNSSTGEATLHSTSSSSGASSRYSSFSTFSVGGVSVSLSETSVGSVPEDLEQEQEQDEEQEEPEQEQEEEWMQSRQSFIPLVPPVAPLPLSLPSRPARPSRPEELVLPANLVQGADGSHAGLQYIQSSTAAEQPRSAFDDDDDDDDRLRLRDSVRWSSLVGKNLSKKLRRRSAEEKEGKEGKEGKETKEAKETKESREPLLSPLLSKKQRMVQATRKVSGHMSHGSTSSFGNARDQQHWREEMKSRIRVIPEGSEGSGGGMI